MFWLKSKLHELLLTGFARKACSMAPFHSQEEYASDELFKTTHNCTKRKMHRAGLAPASTVENLTTPHGYVHHLI